MSPLEIAEVEIDLLERLKEALAHAYFGEDCTAEEARSFLFKAYDNLIVVTQMQAGLPVSKPN